MLNISRNKTRNSHYYNFLCIYTYIFILNKMDIIEIFIFKELTLHLFYNFKTLNILRTKQYLFKLFSDIILQNPFNDVLIQMHIKFNLD